MANQPKKKQKIDIFSDIQSTVEKVARRNDVDRIFDPNYSPEDDPSFWEDQNLLSFKDFCASPEHANFPPLSEKQLEMAEYMLGNDAKKVFNNERNIACLVWGKGSGKDTLSALVQLYLTYILLNMRFPQRYFKLSDNASLDMINVASSKEQAQVVYFEILKRFVLNWEWLKKRWDIVVNGRYFSAQNENTVDFLNKVTITNEAILFPKNIRMFSGNSEAESSEGKSPICFVLDEADAFKGETRSALKIFRTLRSSAKSRYGNKFKGFILSYPRSSESFIMSMYEKAKQSLSFYADKSATWEVLPKGKFSDKYFEFEGKKIPMDFFDDFNEDPMFAKSAYLCDPPKHESPFFGQVEKLEMAMQGQNNLFQFSNYISDQKVCKSIISYPSLSNKKYVVAFDLGETQDSTVLTVGHVDNDKVVIDLITDWEPDYAKKYKVSFSNFEDVLNDIIKHINVIKVGGDHWNCLVGETMVLAGFGEYLRIKTLTQPRFEGKLSVRAFDLDARKCRVASGVIAKKTYDAAKIIGIEIYSVTHGNFTVVKCTPEHKFLLKNGEYIEAQFLSKGDELMPAVMRDRFFVASTFSYTQKEPVYDLHVPGYNNFVICPGIVVHNSALIIQKLNSSGVESSTVKIDFDDYQIFRRYLYAGKVILPKNDKLYRELKDLQIFDGSKVDHLVGKHNDMVVACVLAFKMLLGYGGGQGGADNGLLNNGEFVSENLRTSEVDGTFMPTNKEGINIDGFSF